MPYNRPPHESPAASVVVATYNQSEILPLVLKLLLAQNYPGRWELLICDDGSQDDTFQVIRQTSLPPNVDMRYFWQPRNGERRTKSRNNGLLNATGRVVICMDGDLLVQPDHISKHLSLHTAGHTAVYGARRWIFTGDLKPGETLESAVDFYESHEIEAAKLYSDVPFQRKYENTHAWISCMGFNFSFIRINPPILFDEELVGWGSEDQEFAFRLKERFGYTLRFGYSICSLHVDHRHRKDFIPMRPTEHNDIVQCLRNILYFRNKYSYSEIAPACNGIGYYELNPKDNKWQIAHQPNFTPEYIHAALNTFENWLKDNAQSSECHSLLWR